MKKPEQPQDEAARVVALHNLKLLDTEPDERFDRLTRMAKRMFQTPIALVSLVDTERQWFKSCFGLTVSETPRDISFCGHAILNDDTFLVSDAKQDERFADNPLVVGDPSIGFYAGAPIRTAEGYKIGTLCVIDHVAREFDHEDAELLEDLARMVEKEIAAIQQASMDEVTGISNRRGFYLIAEHSLSLCHRHKSEATLAVFDLEHFGNVVEHYGVAEAEHFLKLFAYHLKQFFRDSDLVGRFGENEFAALMLNTSLDYAQQVIKKLNHSLQSLNRQSSVDYPLAFKVGYSTFAPKQPYSIQTLVEQAMKSLQEKKA